MKKNFLLFLLFLFITFGFFYKTVIYKYVPFPGDLLVSEYSPWKYSSFLGYNPGSYPNKAQYIDTLRQIYPWKTFVIESFKNGAFPLWNPYNFSGTPILANFQSGVFYPLNFLYFLFPQIWAWSSLVILQPLLALLFTFFYARRIGISRTGSFFASFSFAFSSFMSVWLEYNTIGHVILWLPLVLLSLEKLFYKKTAIWSLILVTSLSSSLFAGHIQIFAYLFTFALIYSFARLKKISFFLISLFILSLGIGGIQLIPGIELIMQSARSAHAYDVIIHKVLLQSWQLIMIFVPDFFGNQATRNYWIQDTYMGDVIYLGLVPLFFITLTFFNKKDFFIKFFTVTAVALFIMITLNPLTELIYKVNLPLISASSSNLLVFIICFSLSILCGFGIDIFMKNKDSLKEYLKMLTPLMLTFLLLWIVVLVLPKLHWFLWENNLSISLHNLIYSTIILVIALVLFLLILISNKLKHVIIVLLLLLSIFDLWRFFQKFNPFSPSVFTFPQNSMFEFIKKNNGINRFWGYGSAAVSANFATEFSLFSPEGYDPLYPKRYGEFIQASGNGKIHTEFTDQTRSDGVIAQNLGELKVLDLLGVRYVLDRIENGSTQKIFTIDRFSLVYEQNGWKIFENKKALPRILLADSYTIFINKNDFENVFFDPSFNPAKTILLEEKPDGFETGKDTKLGEAKLISYLPNEINIDVNTDTNKLLFLSDTYYPGWKAYVDEKETEIYRADYTFRAIVVPQGHHLIKFSYDPLSFKIGYIISFLSIGLLVIILTVKKRPHKI
jgi:hypothetical protein